jgi:hypothetical protein
MTAGSLRKTICILANSFKHCGRCVAGIEAKWMRSSWELSENWIRPLSHRPEGEINFKESLLNTKKQPSVLDIVDIELSKPADVAGQPENWLINPNSTWVYRGTMPREVLLKSIETPSDLWLEYPNNPLYPARVSTEFIKKHKSPSLYLIKAKHLQLCIEEHQGKKKMRAKFYYRSMMYNLALTDPRMQSRFFPYFPNNPVETIDNGPAPNSMLCISLAPEWNKKHHKLVAAVI